MAGGSRRRDPRDPALAVALAFMLAAAAWTWAVTSGALATADQAVFDFVARHRGPTGIRLAIAVSYLGSEYMVPVLLLAVAVAVGRRSRPWSWFFVVAVLSATLWQIGLKHLLDVPRPPPVFPYWQKAGYPSGHALAGLCFGWSAAAYLRWRIPGWPKGWGWAAAILLALWPLLVGASRVYLAAHWTSDIVGGILLGVMNFSGIWWYFGAEFSTERLSRPPAGC
jgi:undecaprenyl-diphosphatase